MRKIIMMAAGAATLLASPAIAATEDTTMDVTANVLNSCTVTATPMSFGTLTTLGTGNIDSSSTVGVTCTLGATYVVSMDDGANDDAGQRRLAHATDGTQFIGYDVYSDAARSTVWNATTTPAAATGSGTQQDLTAYGRIPSTAAAVIAGNYSDSVVVTVTF